VLRLPFPSVTEWIPVTPGSVSVGANLSDNTSAAVAPLSVETPAGTWTTVAIVGSSANGTLQATSFVEDYSDLLPSTNGFTFFNAVEGSPALSLIKDDFGSLLGDSGVHLIRAEDAMNPAVVFAENPALELQENAYTLVALVGTPGNSWFFVLPTDESAGRRAAKRRAG
jgi:hypothetical protein